MENNYTDKRLLVVYEVTEKELELARNSYINRNTDVGANYYVELEESVLGRNGDKAILCDLAADFNWNFDWSKYKSRLY